MQSFDVLVIGAGPGGYVAAIRAAQLGLKTACIEKRESLGGTCLNVGCIPSKALLQSSEKFEEAAHNLKDHGIDVKDVRLNLEKMMARKDKVVTELTQGIDYLFKKNKITPFYGTATFTKANEVTVALNKGGEEVITAKHIIIATGSESTPLPGAEVDEKVVVSSTGAIALPAVPKKMIVIGGGYIGLELGSVWQRLGAQVTVVEYLDRLIPGMDQDISKEMQKILKKQGMTFKLSTKVTNVSTSAKSARVSIEPAAGGAGEVLDADVVLVSIGRKPNTEGLGLADIGLSLDDRGRIPVNEQFQTSVPGVYAIGDVIQGPMLAHKAEEEGVVCVEQIAGQSGHINYDAIPGVVYTWPEAASVGKTEQALKEAGTPYKVGKFPFLANGRAKANGNTEGFVKLLSHAETHELLGAHIIGPDAGTMIAELALALEFRASAEDVYRTSHAHPTLNEVVKEAALAVDERVVHG